MKAGGWFVRTADLAKTVRVEVEEARDRGLGQCGRLPGEASERRQSLRRVERRPVCARLVWKPSTAGRAAVLSAERGAPARWSAASAMPRSASVVPFGRPSSIHSSTSNGGSSETARTSGTGTTPGSRNQLRLAASVVKKPGGAAGGSSRRLVARLRDRSRTTQRRRRRALSTHRPPRGRAPARRGRGDPSASHATRLERQASHTRPGSRVLTSCSTQPLPSGSLKFAWFMYGRPCGSGPGFGPPSR